MYVQYNDHHNINECNEGVKCAENVVSSDSLASLPLGGTNYHTDKGGPVIDNDAIDSSEELTSLGDDEQKIIENLECEDKTCSKWGRQQ